MKFTEADILEELDLAFNGIPGRHFPQSNSEDINYNFFLDLEDAYFQIATSKIHLYADETKWAVIFELSGYHNRQMSAELHLLYFGNCIEYHFTSHANQRYISNVQRITLIQEEEFPLSGGNEPEGA